jgi:hypothetical protein
MVSSDILYPLPGSLSSFMTSRLHRLSPSSRKCEQESVTPITSGGEDYHNVAGTSRGLLGIFRKNLVS